MKDAPNIQIDPEVKQVPFDRAEHCRQIAHLGGRKTVDTYGPKFMSEIGKVGFAALMAKYGYSRQEAVVAIQNFNRPGYKPEMFSKDC